MHAYSHTNINPDDPQNHQPRRRRHACRPAHYPTPKISTQVHTKLVPDLAALPTVDAAHVRAIVQRSLNRLHVESLDMVQFHWCVRWVGHALAFFCPSI